MHQLHRKVAIGVMAAALVGCTDFLETTNPNAPDADRALATPAAVEQLIRNSYVAVNQGTYGGSNDAIRPQLLVMGMENFGVNANFGMNMRGSLPRSLIDNTRGNSVELGNYRDFNALHRAARSAAQGEEAMGRPGFTLGAAGNEARARAFSRFVQGVALGYLSLVYDSAAIISVDDDISGGFIPPLSHYPEVNAQALAYLDDAIAISTADNSSFPLPADWLHTGATVSHDEFVRIVRSFKARFRANVARTPQQRDAVNWAAVVDDATNGIQADFVILANPGEGRTVAWPIQHFIGPQWHQMNQFILGMASSQAQYDAWLSNPEPYNIQTPDNRLPTGADRTAQRANPGRYISNRTTNDAPAQAWAFSFYDHTRFSSFYPGLTGAYPVITKAEIDLTAAEGYIRLNQVAQATPLINLTRSASGLPALSMTNTTDPVPGGASCVPRIPVGPNYTSSACGNVLEAMKWEYRMETAYAGYGMWYLAGRGWGDLPEGTAIHFPVPYQEMDTRRTPFYSLGGIGGTDATGPSTYRVERLTP